MKPNLSTDSETGAGGGLGFLRQFLRRPSVKEHCPLCGMGLVSVHEHVFELSTRRLLCLCNLCAILTSGNSEGIYRRIPRRVQFLQDFRMTEWQWDRLQIPVNLAFFYCNSAMGKIAVGYPSPAGLIEALVGQEVWDALVVDNPVLQKMSPDVEALLANRMGNRSEYFLVPMDDCFRLIGLMRTSWHGLSGGPEAQKGIDAFFIWLKGHEHA